MKITKRALANCLAKHEQWLAGKQKGIRADLNRANLVGVNLSGTNLCNADLRAADLRMAYLRKANLYHADLRNADLRNADLRNADLRMADLSHADLRKANLCEANLRGATLDYSSGIPLWCGGAHFKCGERLIQQVLAHLMTLDCDSPAWVKLRDEIMPFARKSHRADNLEILED